MCDHFSRGLLPYIPSSLRYLGNRECARHPIPPGGHNQHQSSAYAWTYGCSWTKLSRSYPWSYQRKSIISQSRAVCWAGETLPWSNTRRVLTSPLNSIFYSQPNPTPRWEVNLSLARQSVLPERIDDAPYILQMVILLMGLPSRVCRLRRCNTSHRYWRFGRADRATKEKCGPK